MNANRIFAIGTAIAIAAILGLAWLVGLSPLLAAAALADQDRVVVEQNNAAQQARLANMKSDFDTFNRIYAEYFPKNQPCRTTVEVNALPTPIAIELKCVAVAKEE